MILLAWKPGAWRANAWRAGTWATAEEKKSELPGYSGGRLSRRTDPERRRPIEDDETLLLVLIA